jgi:ADP-heptose:LPS heptosyltransferase|tara:strand:- start:4107 stop:5117 length:1011 start_codon:yes stop_codon:yes gene_type:complete
MKIVVTEFCGLGNSVLLSSGLKTLKNADFHITLIGNNKFGGMSIHQHSKFIDERIDLSKFTYKIFTTFFKSLKNSDYIIIPAHSNPSFFFLFILSLIPKKKIIISYKYFSNLNFIKKKFLKYTKKINKNNFIEIEYTNKSHEIEINRKFIDAIDFSFEKISENILINYFDHPGDDNCIKKFMLEDKKYIVIQPFCANGLNNYGKLSKTWPFENFQKLTDILLKKYKDYCIILVGDEGDAKNLNHFKKNDKIINLLSKTSLSELISLLKNSSFIICHDSSILHISDAMNLKNLSLFGPTIFEKNKPNHDNSFFIKNLSMDKITVDEVSEVINKNINN